MAANAGRNLVIKKNSTAIAGVRTKGIAVNNEPIDVTTDDEDGVRTLLSDPATTAVNLSVEGLTKDRVLRQAILGGGSLMLTDITIDYPNGDTLSGNFFFGSLEETGEYQGAVTFTGELQSSGTITYSAGSP